MSSPASAEAPCLWHGRSISGYASLIHALARAATAPALPEILIHALAARMPPPALPEIPDSTMLAVASVPGKIPEQWQPAGPLWMAWPHAEGADLAVEMTAAQLRARLAGGRGR